MIITSLFFRVFTNYYLINYSQIEEALFTSGNLSNRHKTRHEMQLIEYKIEIPTSGLTGKDFNFVFKKQP